MVGGKVFFVVDGLKLSSSHRIRLGWKALEGQRAGTPAHMGVAGGSLASARGLSRESPTDPAFDVNAWAAFVHTKNYRDC